MVVLILVLFVIIIQVGRPSQMPQAQNCIDEIQAEAKNYHRIYVSSIHKVSLIENNII